MPNWLETATAILLSVAGLTTAWASYQASLWGGEQVSHYSVAGGMLTAASQLDIRAGQVGSTDTALFIAWVDAAHNGEEDRSSFLEQRFSPAFAKAFADWRPQFPADLTSYALPPAGKRIPVPQPEYPEAAKATDLRAEAQRTFEAGEKANSIGDRFVAITVLLSTVLFLGGISQLMKRPKPRIGMIVLASLLCLGSLVWLLTLPSASL